MTVIAITLITIGLADVLCRGGRSASLTHPVPALGFAFLFPVLLAWSVGIATTSDWLVLYLGIGTAIGWVFASHRATAHGTRPGVPLGIRVGGLAALALFGTQSTLDGCLAQPLKFQPGIERGTLAFVAGKGTRVAGLKRPHQGGTDLRAFNPDQPPRFA